MIYKTTFSLTYRQAVCHQQGEGEGHMGIVEGFRDDRLITIEGNTNLPGDREGVGVFRRTTGKLSDINKGLIRYDS